MGKTVSKNKVQNDVSQINKNEIVYGEHGVCKMLKLGKFILLKHTGIILHNCLQMIFFTPRAAKL